ncbi:solute carrier family 35 member B1 homolog [Chironomus tepperi]|uniref:solute carrier family 35 member B1 homolog n=1 Tax=Chironomus tepperi TaxID=113505 RepID=UPI00391FB977
MSNLKDKQYLLISAVGIFVCYFYFGIMQEKITRGRYGTEENEDGTVGERFTYTLALVAVQCMFNYLFVKAILIVKPQPKDTTHTGYYASSALTYLLAMVSSNMALRWVAYPTQVVAKAAKPIPVMILGVLLGRKSYSLRKYLFVLIIVIGVVLFMYKEGKVNKNSENAGLGEILLFLSLSMDGLTGAIQERMRASSRPSAQHMMLSMNSWSSVMLGAALLVTGEGKEFFAFALKHPELFTHLILIALASAFGQLFIFMMVAGFGPLPCSIVTTTRKFFTVLFSVLFFGNVLIGRQWFGAILVFIGLFADMFFGKKEVDPKKNEGKKLIENEK